MVLGKADNLLTYQAFIGQRMKFIDPVAYSLVSSQYKLVIVH